MKQEYVWMHKKTGQLYEVVYGWFGRLLFFKDTTTEARRNKPITRESPVIFDDDDHFNLDDYEELGPL